MLVGKERGRLRPICWESGKRAAPCTKGKWYALGRGTPAAGALELASIEEGSGARAVGGAGTYGAAKRGLAEAALVVAG